MHRFFTYYLDLPYVIPVMNQFYKSFSSSFHWLFIVSFLFNLVNHDFVSLNCLSLRSSAMPEITTTGKIQPLYWANDHDRGSPLVVVVSLRKSESDVNRRVIWSWILYKAAFAHILFLSYFCGQGLGSTPNCFCASQFYIYACKLSTPASFSTPTTT